jgi:catechol 2,3-dioxygenase-like lactoylglutathione lyase family enzyme
MARAYGSTGAGRPPGGRAPAVRSGIATFHHVNLGVPPGGLDEESDWLRDVLAYRRIDAGPDLPTANWFEADDGSQVHLSTDPEHRPADRAHVAVVVGDLDRALGRLDARGTPYDRVAREDLVVAICRDPAGNRWELRSRA